MNLQPPVH